MSADMPVRDAEGKKTYRKQTALILTFFIEWGLKVEIQEFFKSGNNNHEF